MQKELLNCLERNGNKKDVVKLVCFPGEFLSGVSRFFVSDGKTSVRSKIGRCWITTFRQNTDFNVGLTPDLHAKQRGFTLIELLVVVLIIGILAAVALPQYRLAVDKARLANLVAMTKNVVEAQEAYYLANNTYTKDWDELAVTLPGTVNSNVMSSTDGWTIRLLKEGGGAVNGLTAEDSRVPDVLLYAFYDHNTVPEQFYGMMCYVSRSNAHAVKLCKNMSQSKNAISGNDSQLVYRFE